MSTDSVSAGGLDEVVEALASWQRDGMPVQLHPGDLGWHWRLGSDRLARALRVWRDGGEIVAVGFVDDGSLVRMGLAADRGDDADLARRLVRDLAAPGAGVLTAPDATVEARFGRALRAELAATGWGADEEWTPLSRDLTGPVARDDALDVAQVGPDDVEDRVAVQRASFESSTFTAERWQTMAASAAYRRARCLVGRNARGEAVAAVTVWSAGEGRPGLVEPMGVHRDHRGLGYGRAITVAAAAALRDMGASSMLVATPSTNVGGIRTYLSAGMTAHDPVCDLRRPG